MNLREEILKEHSRRQMLKITGWIGNNPERFSRLLDIFLHDEYRVVQRSAMVLGYTAEKYPEMVKPFLPKLVDRLYDSDIHVAVKRNVVRILQFIPVPEKLQAKVMNKCFDYLNDPIETVAVRCFSMTVLVKLAEKYPEIKNEISASINISLKNSTAGYRARAKKELKQLEKLPVN
jgi:hypothetical protein